MKNLGLYAFLIYGLSAIADRVYAQEQRTFYNNSGQIVGHGRTGVDGVETFTDERGSIAGSRTPDGAGGYYYRDETGRLVGQERAE